MNLLRNKKGDEPITLKQILEIIFAVIIIIILIVAGQRIFSTYFGNQKELQAKGTLDAITQRLNALEEGVPESYLLQAPTGWYLVAFDSSHNSNKDFAKPQQYFGANALCVCEKKCTICQSLKMPLKQGDEIALVKIELADIWLVNMKDYYNITKIKPTIASTLTDKEKTEIGLRTTATSQVLTNQNYNTIIDSTAHNYYPQVQDYFVNEEEFNKLIRAMIIIESSAEWNAIGADGEVGLMQLMPQTADAWGLKIYDPENRFTGKGWSVKETTYRQTTYYNALKELVATKTKSELIELDERFDEAKNIDAGTRHLVGFVTEFKDWELGVMAYNAGGGNEQEDTGVRGHCKPLVVTSCEKDFAGLIYLQMVKASMEKL